MMRFLISFLAVGFLASHAYAQVDPDPTPAPVDSSLSFQLSSPSAGCVNVDSIYGTDTFPNLPNGLVTEVRFYYSTDSFDKITQDSPYMQSELIVDDNHASQLATPGACGFTSGSKTFFKYGLVDTNGTVLKFMDNSEYSDYQDSVQVQ